MKRIFLKTISLKLVILFGAVFIMNTEKAEAQESDWSKMVGTIVYSNNADVGVEIFGYELPGISISVQTDPIGTNFNCEFSWNTCVGDIGYVPFPK